MLFTFSENAFVNWRLHIYVGGGIYNNHLELNKSQNDIDKISALAPGTYYQVLSKLWLLGHLAIMSALVIVLLL